jgi:hypothetical protein
MIPLLLRLVLLVAAAWWLLVALGFVASPFSRTIIRIRNGQIRVNGADLSTRAREHVSDVIREAMIFSGFISLSAHGGVRFSRDVPESVHQRLRNILLN